MDFHACCAALHKAEPGRRVHSLKPHDGVNDIATFKVKRVVSSLQILRDRRNFKQMLARGWAKYLHGTAPDGATSGGNFYELLETIRRGSALIRNGLCCYAQSS